MSYPEIIKLKGYFRSHNIQISTSIQQVRNDLFFTKVHIDNLSFDLLIDDEFKDFSKGNLLFNWFLVLYALELHKESEDILEWSRELRISPETYLEYYKQLNVILPQIEALIGPIDSCISSFDYTLRTGVIKELEQSRPD